MCQSCSMASRRTGPGSPCEQEHATSALEGLLHRLAGILGVLERSEELGSLRSTGSSGRLRAHRLHAARVCRHRPVDSACSRYSYKWPHRPCAGHEPAPRSSRQDVTVSRRELDAAGISDPRLRESYEACRRLNAAHGKTYYLATLLLPPESAPSSTRSTASPGTPTRSSTTSPAPSPTSRRPTTCTTGARSSSSTSTPATATTRSAGPSSTPSSGGTSRASTSRRSCTRWRWISPSPSTPTTTRCYEYVYGSAAVIGLQMVPILEPTLGRRLRLRRWTSASRSSSPTSSATSAKTSTAVASTCRWPTSSSSA